MQTESSGSGFNEDGSLKIRFELHILRDRIRNIDPTVFDRHFKIEGSRIFDHFYRRSPGDPWKRIHNNYKTEYEALNLALEVFPGEQYHIYSSLGMGVAQIMGFNHLDIGYGDPGEMYRAFSESEDNQLLGFKNYIANRGSLVRAIENKDWRAIALHYNGSGSVDDYAAKVRRNFEELRSSK